MIFIATFRLSGWLIWSIIDRNNPVIQNEITGQVNTPASLISRLREVIDPAADALAGGWCCTRPIDGKPCHDLDIIIAGETRVDSPPGG